MNEIKTLTIATRKSPLALWQTEYVKSLLVKTYPHLEIELLGLLTEGDKQLATPLAKIGGKGLFVKELEKAILEKEQILPFTRSKICPWICWMV